MPAAYTSAAEASILRTLFQGFFACGVSFAAMSLPLRPPRPHKKDRNLRALAWSLTLHAWFAGVAVMIAWRMWPGHSLEAEPSIFEPADGGERASIPAALPMAQSRLHAIETLKKKLHSKMPAQISLTERIRPVARPSIRCRSPCSPAEAGMGVLANRSPAATEAEELAAAVAGCSQRLTDAWNRVLLRSLRASRERMLRPALPSSSMYPAA